MKSLFALTCLLVSFTCGVHSQNYYSKLTRTANESLISESFELNGGQFHLSRERCDSIAPYSCILISQILSDGQVVLRTNLGKKGYSHNVLAVDNNHILLAWSTDSSLQIEVLDSSFQAIESTALTLPELIGVFTIKKIIANTSHYFIFGDNNLWNQKEKGLIYKINKTDLSVSKILPIEPLHAAVNLYDAAFIGTDSVIVQRAHYTNQTNPLMRFDIYNTSLELLDSVITDIVAHSSSHHFARTQQGNYIVDRRDSLISVSLLDESGIVIWDLALASLFEGQNAYSFGILDMKVDINSDIILCGYVEARDNAGESFLAGFIAKITSDGTIVWSRIYSVSPEQSIPQAVLSKIYLTEDGYLFAGQTDNYPLVLPYNYFWVLKTDFSGCIDPLNCEDLQIVNIINKVNNQKAALVKILENPIRDQLTITILSDDIKSIMLTQQSGKVIREFKRPNIGELTINLSNIPAGLIQLVATSTSNHVQFEKIIKTH